MSAESFLYSNSYPLVFYDSVYKACDAIRPMGYGFRKEPDGGSMKGLAFCYDPDGYSVEIIKRGGIDFGDAKKEA